MKKVTLGHGVYLSLREKQMALISMRDRSANRHFCFLPIDEEGLLPDIQNMTHLVPNNEKITSLKILYKFLPKNHHHASKYTH